MNLIKKILLNPKVYIALGAIVMFVGCIVGKHDYSVAYVFPNAQFYKSAGLLFGGYAIMAIFTVIDAKRLKPKTN